MAKRAVAQSAAREFGPQGIHVAHIVVDGVVDNPNTRKYFAEKVSSGLSSENLDLKYSSLQDEKFGKMFEARSAQNALIKPDSVAQLYWQLHNQVRIQQI